jgi:formylglycine-generating enzyme required for sulfatase activity
MSKIFISYRRADSAYVTDNVYSFMRGQFGEGNVFLDVGSVPPGVDFREHLREQIAAHDVVLVMIGPQWAQMIQERANQSNDFVRIEIESALAQGKLVIPVRVMGAALPDFSTLPASIQELQWRNAAEIRRQPDFDGDCARVAQGIRDYVAHRPATITKPRSRDLLPQPFDWIEIPGKGYSIAKYPVTNAQFKLFIDAGGYTNRRWWTEAGWKARAKRWEWKDNELVEIGKPWSQPRYWKEAKWNGAEQPVVGASWYEAVAYCLWLSETTGEEIMLPTEDQWQYAAQGDDGRLYPWGNEWDCNRCNNRVKPCMSDRTSPVRKYEGKGDSPFGVVDMAGNVWEWCLTDYEENTNDIHSTADSRVLRGGSWYLDYSHVFRCDFRGRDAPHFWGGYGGFRLALSS